MHAESETQIDAEAAVGPPSRRPALPAARCMPRPDKAKTVTEMAPEVAELNTIAEERLGPSKLATNEVEPKMA